MSDSSPTTAPDYLPEAGCVADRVLDLFIRQPDEEYTSGDLALKFQLRPGSFQACLAAPMNHGLLVHQADAGEKEKVWRAGPRFTAWLQARSARLQASSVFAVGRAAAKPPGKRGGARKHLPRLDPAKLTFETNAPKPHAPFFARRGESKYAALFERLTAPGMSVRLPIEYHGTIQSMIKKRKAAGQGLYSVARIDEQTFGLWRDQ